MLSTQQRIYCIGAVLLSILSQFSVGAKLFWREGGWVEEHSRQVVLAKNDVLQYASECIWTALPIIGRADVNIASRYEDGLGFATPWTEMNLKFLEKGMVDLRAEVATGQLVVDVASGSNEPIRDARWGYIVERRPIQEGGMLRIRLKSDKPATLLLWRCRPEEVALEIGPESTTYLIPLSCSQQSPIRVIQFLLFANDPTCRVVIEKLEWGHTDLQAFKNYIQRAVLDEWQLVHHHRIIYHRRGCSVSGQPFDQTRALIEQLASISDKNAAQQTAQQLDDLIRACYVQLSRAVQWLSERRRLEHLQMKIRTVQQSGIEIPEDIQGHIERVEDELSRQNRTIKEGLFLPDLMSQTAWRLDRIAQMIHPLFMRTGKSVYWHGRQFYWPDGTPTTFIGNEITRNMHFVELKPTEARFVFNEAYFRLISALGLNGVRVVVTYARLEPQQGQIHEGYWDQCKRAIELADKYGLMCAIDLHWPHPEWFIKGPKDSPNGMPGANWSNIFQNPEALLWTWGQIGKRLAGYRNIAVIEVPANEPILGSEDIKDVNKMVGIQTQPVLMRSWNEFLKNRYRTLDQLKKAWTVKTNEGQELYRLDKEETWGTIRPFGYQYINRQGDEFSENWNYMNNYGQLYERWKALVGQEIHLMNPRLLDYLDWAAHYRSGLCQRIAEAVMPNVPRVAFMEQYIIGDIWEPSPVPLNYRVLSQITGPNTCLGTHYEIGGWAAVKARALGLPCYDSEQVMDHRRLYFVKGKILEQGFSAHNDLSNHPTGPRVFANDECLLKADLIWLGLGSDFYNKAVAKSPKVSVAVIENTCKAALAMGAYGQIYQFLSNLCGHVDVLESLYVGKNPAILSRYEVLVADLDYLEPAALEALLKCDKSVVFYGRINDYRWQGQKTTADLLARYGWVKDAKSLLRSQQTSVLDLSGQWKFKYDMSSQNQPTDAQRPNFAEFAGLDVDDKDWGQQRVPGMWKEFFYYQSQAYFIGDGWYRTHILIPDDWAGCDLELNIQAIDDYDWTYFNGQYIGHTDKNTPSWWTAPRRYRIPAALVKAGQINVLAIRVVNDYGEGGIVGEKVILRRLGQSMVSRLEKPLGDFSAGQEKEVTLLEGIGLTSSAVDKSVEVFVQSQQRVILCRKGQQWIYNVDALRVDGAWDIALLTTVLNEKSIPVRPESEWGLTIGQFDRGFAVVNESDQAKIVKLISAKALLPLLDPVLDPKPIEPNAEGVCEVNMPAKTGQFFQYVN